MSRVVTLSKTQLIQDKANGMTNKEMATKYGITLAVITNALKSAGIDSRAARKVRVNIVDDTTADNPLRMPETDGEAFEDARETFKAR